MPTIRPKLSLPEEFMARLRSGELSLHGGVLVDATTQRVVKWLDEVDAVCLEGMPDAVRLAEFGASMFLQKDVGGRLARIEEKLEEISQDVKELLRLDADDRKATGTALISDLSLRLRKGLQIDPTLARELHRAQDRVARTIRRASSSGLEKARDEGSMLKFLLIVPGIMAEGRADRRAGELGSALATLLAEYSAVAFARGLSLSSIAPEDLAHWEREFADTVYLAASGMVRASCYWHQHVYPGWRNEDWEEKLKAEGVEGCFAPDNLVGLAALLPELKTTIDVRRCPDQCVTSIQNGLCHAASLIDTLRGGPGLIGEVVRMSHRLRFLHDGDDGMRWLIFECEPDEMPDLYDALTRTPAVKRVERNPFGAVGLAAVMQQATGIAPVEAQLRSDGLDHHLSAVRFAD